MKRSLSTRRAVLPAGKGIGLEYWSEDYLPGRRLHRSLIEALLLRDADRDNLC